MVEYYPKHKGHPVLEAQRAAHAQGKNFHIEDEDYEKYPGDGGSPLTADDSMPDFSKGVQQEVGNRPSSYRKSR